LDILQDIIHDHSLDGDTAAALAEFALSEHRFYRVLMSVFSVHDFCDNFYLLVDIFH